jgi:3-hydroxyacyl-[acyl-carrier-protein] dehydratase
MPQRKPADEEPLELGPQVIELLLPHRRPFVMVDRIVSFSGSPRPTLRARRAIGSNEQVFEGHFPGLSLWPGVYTIEGMGQTCNLLHVLRRILESYRERGGDPREVLLALRNLELGFRLHPGFKRDAAEALLERLPDPASSMGLSARVDVKLLAPVFAGQVVEYRATEVHSADDWVQWEVEAEVERRAVASGNMTARIGIANPLLALQKKRSR